MNYSNVIMTGLATGLGFVIAEVAVKDYIRPYIERRQNNDGTI